MGINEEIEAFKKWRSALDAVFEAEAAIPKEDKEKPEAYEKARELDKIASDLRKKYEAIRQ